MGVKAVFTAFALILGCCLRADAEVIGVVYKGDQTFLELKYVNSGKFSVRIAAITTSCDCLESLDKPADVPAGGTFDIHLIHHALNTGSIEIDVKLLDKSGATIADLPVRGFVPDRSWSISREDAQTKGSVLIDTRSQAEFVQIHAANAINVPAFALKTRRDLKNSKIVLIDDGVDSTDLLEEVDSLRKHGFSSVYFVGGGLPGWVRSGGAVEGANASVLGVARITAAEFFRSNRDTKWLIVRMGEKIPASVGLSEAGQLDRAEEVDAVLGALSKTWGKQSPPNILIIAPGDSLHPKIEAHLGAEKALNVYYLKGGAEALARFHAQQVGMANNSGALARTSSRRNTAAIVRPCGSCGK